MSAKNAASLAVGAVLLACPGSADAAEPEFVPGQLLVRFDPGVGKAQSSELAADQGGDVTERYGIVPRLALVDLPPGLGVKAAESRFEELDDVAFAQPNLIYHEALTPNDEFFASTPNALWGLDNTGQLVPDDNSALSPFTDPPFPTEAASPPGIPDADIDAPEGWNTETGDPAIRVGVIDSGLTAAHEDIAPNLWTNPDEIPRDLMDNSDANVLIDDVNGWDFVENDNTPDDAAGHGTHVAGAIGAAGNNLVGTTGAAWDVSLIGLKAGSADGRLYTGTILGAIQYVDEMGIPIVNGSYIGGGSDNPPDAERIAYGNADETLFVVAAGNSTIDVDNTVGTAAFPCAYTLPNIICVAATTPSDGIAGFSNFGVKSVDVGAPGTHALSTEPKFGTPVFSDDFEDTTLNKWVVETGDWFNSAETPRLGARALTDSPGGYYANNEDSAIRMKDPVNLTGLESCRLSTASAFTLSAGDTLRTEFTTDLIPGPPPTWQPLFSLNVPYTGNGAFTFRNLDMDMMGATGQANVRIRFRLVTNSSGTADGAHLDNVKIECVDPSPGSQAIYRVRQGTSMASPVVAGVAALVLSDDPGLTVEQLRNTLLSSVDPLAALKCKTTTGGRINAATALAISPAASAPPAPSCHAGTVQTPVINPPVINPPVEDLPAKQVKCKKAKKGASAKAKARAKKKCKRKRNR